MKSTVHICFLGDTQVGKTTFLAALYRTNHSSGHMSTTFDDVNQTGTFLGMIADSIEKNSGAPPTTDTIRFQARLVWEKNQYIPIEFVDIPGERFSEAYRSTNDSEIKEMRNFINTCSFLYFFIDPELLEKDISENKRRIFTPLKNLYKDYYDKNPTAPVLCLTLTKIDKYKEYWSDDGLSIFKSKINEYYQDDLEIIEKYTSDIHMACISSFYEGDSTKLELTEKMFAELFDPLKTMCMEEEGRLAKEQRKSRRKKIVFYTAIALMALLLVYPWYEYERDRVQQFGKSRSGFFEYYEDQKQYVTRRLEQAPSSINDDNLERARKQYENLALTHPRFKQHILEQWIKVRTPYQTELHNRILDVILDLRAHPDLSKCDHYDSLRHLYTNNIDASLPQELILDKYNLFMTSRIDEILKIQFRGRARDYVHSRMMALRDFIALKPDSQESSFSAENLSELKKSIEIGEALCESKHYNVIIKSRGLSKECNLFYRLQIGPDNAASQVITSKKTFQNSRGASTEAFHFTWNIDQKIKVSLMTESFTIKEVCADIWRDSNDNDVALSLLASDKWQENSYNFGNSYAKNVEFQFIMLDSEGLVVAMEDIELVRRYILGNQFWSQLKEQLLKP